MISRNTKWSQISDRVRAFGKSPVDADKLIIKEALARCINAVLFYMCGNGIERYGRSGNHKAVQRLLGFIPKILLKPACT